MSLLDYQNRCAAMMREIDRRVAALDAQKLELPLATYQARYAAILEDREVLMACVADWKRQAHSLHIDFV